MQITIVSAGKVIPASELISATLRTDLVPIPSSIEFTVQSTAELDSLLKEGEQLTVNDISHPFELIKVTPLKTQTIKQDRRVGGISCIGILAGCKRLIENSKQAVISNETSFNSVIRACGATISLGSDLPLPKFVCLKGSMPTQRLAHYLQQEAAVICFQNNKVSAQKIDSLFKQEAITKLDPSSVVWISSKPLELMQKSSFVTVENNGSTVVGDDSITPGHTVKQRAGLDARQVKNLEKVLILRGTIIRPLNLNWNAGDIFEIDSKKYVVLTAAPDMGSSNYLLSAVKPNLGEWQEVVMYLKGKSTGAASGLGTIDNPRTFPALAEYYAPMFIGNYSAQPGISQFNFMIIEDNNSLASANDSTATANDLFKTATNRTDAEAERTSELEARVENAETGIKTNAQAITKTATKSDLDSALSRVSTDITAAVQNIKVGGVNVVANSEAPRTSTAATSREYLMYERSKELKAFYDENLDKPVTISFEMSVPVAGAVLRNAIMDIWD